jgi:hypothetical protein
MWRSVAESRRIATSANEGGVAADDLPRRSMEATSLLSLRCRKKYNSSGFAAHVSKAAMWIMLETNFARWGKEPHADRVF